MKWLDEKRAKKKEEELSKLVLLEPEEIKTWTYHHSPEYLRMRREERIDDAISFIKFSLKTAGVALFGYLMYMVFAPFIVPDMPTLAPLMPMLFIGYALVLWHLLRRDRY